jgi:hypothetical protein
MKIKVTVAVDVDQEAWAREFGLERKDEVRKDVQAYFKYLCLCYGQLDNLGLGKE